MSTIKSSDEHLTLNADGSSKDIKFQANGVEKASISSAGAFTSTTIDATKLTGTIPNFTSTGIDDNADATAITINSGENVGIGVTPESHNASWTGVDIAGVGNLTGETATSAGNQFTINNNAYLNTSGNWVYKQSSDEACQLQTFDGKFRFRTAPTGTADSAVTFTERMLIANNGETSIDTTAGGLKNNIEIKSAGSKAGIVGCEGSTNIVVGSGDIGLKMDNVNNIYRPYNVNTASGEDNNGDLGSSSHRFKVVYAGTGSINTSDERHKNNITDTDLGLDFVTKLKPKKYKLNDGQSGRTHYGLISQDVETLLGEISKSTTDFAGFIKTDISEDNKKDIENIDLVLNDETKNLTEEQIEELNVAKTKVQNKNDDIYALRYEEFISPIIKAIQELEARITALEA